MTPIPGCERNDKRKGITKMIGNSKSMPCLVVGNYCHDVLMKDDVVLAESLGGAAAFISAVLDGVSIPSTFVSKVGPDFAYSVTHPPLVSPSFRTTLFHAHFSSKVQRQDRVLKRVQACDPIAPSDLPQSRRFEFGLAVGVGGEILPETLEKMLDICETVLVDVQALIRVFDRGDGTVRLVNLRDSGFYHLLPRIGLLKASSDETPYIDVDEAKTACCVVLTNGEDGCRVHYKDVDLQIAPFPTVQVDPTGAGDSFLGGLVFGLTQGLTVPDAALLGNLFGSLTVSQVGLPKFDMSLLQAVKNEHRKRLQFFGCREGLNDELVFTKSSDHDNFHASLVRAKNISTTPQECELEWPPDSPQVLDNHSSNLPCSIQPTLFSGNSREEPIKLGDGMPR